MKKYIGILCFLLLLMGCQPKERFFPTEMQTITVCLQRFDNALLQVREDSVRKDINGLYQHFPDFMPVFMEDILGIDRQDTNYLCSVLPAFLNDTLYGFQQTNQYEHTLFQDVSDIETSLSDALSRIHYLYPTWHIPSLYLFVSGFQTSLCWVGEDLAIGADMYLGSDYPYYNRVVHHYQKQTMRKECIPADVVSAYLYRNIPYPCHQRRLLDRMLYQGRIMFLLSACFPNLPNYEVMGYTKEQWRWCEQHEQDIWNMMMDKKDLFKYDNMTLASYLNDGPFTSEISQQCPARIGVWMGWRIIDSYVQHQDTISLTTLMSQSDSQLLLEQSAYRPSTPAPTLR